MTIVNSKSIVIEELANGDKTIAHGPAARNVIFILGIFMNVEASLIASVLESISIFTQEVLHKGGLREILLEDSVIYIDRATNYNCHFILISNNRSEVLKRNLHVFGDLFMEKFEKLLETLQKPMIETTQFEVANQLIPLAFPYIPGNL